MSNNQKTALIMGITYAIINAFMLAGMSLFSKLLATYFWPAEVVFLRNAFSLIVLIAWLGFTGNLIFLKTQRPFSHLFRGTIGTIGILLGAWALSLMPLAETTILLFTAPLFVVLLSYPVLKEPVGIYRLGAVIFGFMGVIVMINPGQGVSTLPVLGIIVGLGWGFFAGCVDTCLRWIGRTENSWATVFYFVLFGTITCGLHLPFAEAKIPLSIDALWITMGLGITGLLALLAKTQSFRLAEATVISPVMYSMIIWTMMFDYMFWGKVPTPNIVIGASIIIASNIFILYRETASKKNRTGT